MSIIIHDEEPKTYVVLGAPGSATSFISKCLEEAGVDMGNTKGNKEKYYENHDFVNFNTRILHRAGGWWGDPPSEEAIMKSDVGDGVRKKVEKWKTDKWGFKDPRTSLTIKRYLPYLDGDAYLVCIFRKPEKVLNRWKRDRLTHGTRELVDRYNRSIISAIKEFVGL